MPREGSSLFVGRIDKRSTTRDLEDIFDRYGHLTRCELKYGAEMAYAFLDYEDRKAAAEAIRYENGRNLQGTTIIVEYAKGKPRQSSDWRDSGYRSRRRSPPPRRRRRSYSRSRSRSHSRDRSSRRRKYSRSQSRSRSRSRSDRKKSSSKSPRRSGTAERNGSRVKSGSRSKSPSRSRSRSKSTD